MKSTELLSYLSDLELKLNSFSFEELTSDEAKRLKKSFQSFKENLEEKSRFKNLKAATASLKKDDPYQAKKGQTNIHLNKDELFMAKVSHEIRTPLNGIIGFTELLGEEKLTEEQHAHVHAIKMASKTLLTIINELSGDSKLSSGISYSEEVDFNIRNVIKDVCYVCKTLIINPHVAFHVSISENIPEIIKGDPSRLSQLLLNLIGNAIKVVVDGSIDLTVEVASMQEHTVLLNFKVKDTGIGIPKEHLENIFDQQSENSHEKDGDSGLNIVKHIVELLEGKIGVTSEVGVGTVFDFELPYTIPLSKIQTSIAFTDPIKDKEKRLKNMNILVFADHTRNQNLLQKKLNSWGCICFVTDNTEDGLRVMENGKIDLILLDVRMPKIIGFVVSKVIRNHTFSKINTLPIIALTADLTKKDKDICTKNGINDFIVKPFNSKELWYKLASNSNRINKIEPMKIATVSSKGSINDPFDIDLAPVLQECFGDLELLEELIRLFKQNAIEFIGKTKVSLKAADIEEVAFSTHKIKSGLRMMHTHGLYRIVDQMHKVCVDDQDFKYLNFLYDCFLKEYPFVQSAIENAFDKLKSAN